jgi:hypothetical protein
MVELIPIAKPRLDNKTRSRRWREHLVTSSEGNHARVAATKGRVKAQGERTTGAPERDARPWWSPGQAGGTLRSVLSTTRRGPV